MEVTTFDLPIVAFPGFVHINIYQIPASRHVVRRAVNRMAREYSDFCMIVGKPKDGKDTCVRIFTLLDGSRGILAGSSGKPVGRLKTSDSREQYT